MSLSIERPVSADPNEFQARDTAPGGRKPMFEGAGPSFGDLLDVINPLQHLPVIGTIYRALTGDALSDGARLAGGALFGGPIGLVAAMANLGVREAIGRDVGEIVVAALAGEEALGAAPEAPVQLAASQSAAVAALEPAGGATASPEPQPAAEAPMPQLSSEAFDALLRSVNQPAAAPQQTLAQTAAAPTVAPAAAAAKRPAAWSRANPLGGAPVAMPPAVRAAAGAGVPTIGPASPGTRQASLELHNALRLYAQQNGIAPIR